MIDREKVIKGLECCIKEPSFIEDCEKFGCPYSGTDCLVNLYRDALRVIRGDEDD